MIQDFIAIETLSFKKSLEGRVHGFCSDVSSQETSGAPFPSESETWLNWKTCLREMYFGFSDWDTPSHINSALKLKGGDAYKYVLEVICGLHSPMLGETEVMGQFKKIALDPKVSPKLAPIFRSLLADAKVLRKKYLENLGSHSYGSLVRKKTEAFRGVAILGSGQLCQEVLPWLRESEIIEVLSRDVSEARKKLLKSQSPHEFPAQLVLKSLSDSSKMSLCEVLVVASPISAGEVSQVCLRMPKLRLVLDLREVSSVDQVIFTGQMKRDIKSVTLSDFFEDLDRLKGHSEEKIKRALHEIGVMVGNKSKQVELRPFGWDDLCA